MEEYKCPLNNEERKKYCLCDTCQFVKQCFEDFDNVIDGMNGKIDVTEKKVQRNLKE